ncbi:ATP-binding protein (plasmid) [Sphaerotilus natans]|uniref:ATP-binding protein n=1 Tax=Sphaerotilus natans TaxID=34103 RepID=UPI00406CCE92
MRRILPPLADLVPARPTGRLLLMLAVLLAAAWWPLRVDALLGELAQGCSKIPAGTPCVAGAQIEQLRAALHGPMLGLQLLLGLSLIWLLAEPGPRARAEPGLRPPAPPCPSAEATSPDCALLGALGRIGQGLVSGSGGVGAPQLLRALAMLQQTTGARGVALQLSERATRGLGCAPLLCSPGGLGQDMPADGAARPADRAVPGRLLLPLRDAIGLLGTLQVDLPDAGADAGRAGPCPASGRTSTTHAAEAFAAMAALAIAGVCHGHEERRLALLEERGAIAAELHDSLAQSLAFMRIGVARLQAGLGAQQVAPELLACAAELRAGLSDACRQIRELIAAFRVRMGPGGLQAAVQDSIDELAQRGGLDIAFEHELDRCPLDVNEEFHVMQVIREALSNTVRHAGARQAWVAVRAVAHRLEVTIDDDGSGPDDPVPREGGHHGLAIMRERARSLGGELEVGDRPGGGMRVRLAFTPRQLPGGALHAEAA